LEKFQLLANVIKTDHKTHELMDYEWLLNW